MSQGRGDEVERDEPTNHDALVVSLAQSFSDRHRRGERPTIEEYVAQHPDLEAEIRELFPMLCVLEDLGPATPERGAAVDGHGGGPPRQLGEYRIIREIGRGGMGVVYEAEQESLKRRVALKVLPFQAFQDEHQLERFRREAQAAARLHHTNIVPVFGVGEDQGVHYFVMQFIRGQTLDGVLQEVRRLRTRKDAEGSMVETAEDLSAESVARTLLSGDGKAADPAPLADDGSLRDESTTSLGKDPRGVYFQSIAHIALQVAEGLAYAHHEGVLHRDIKPSNLLLDLKGIVWITDFGLAKVQGSGEITVSGSLVGTLRYMAPERFRGTGDARSDVYSLGITIYELATLRPAFAASDRAEMMRDVTSREPVPPRRLDPSIPRDLETIVLKAIAKEPRDRYSNAAALADDLRRFIHHEPVSARRASVPERLWRWSQRNPALATLTGVSAVLLIALTLGSMVSAARERAARDEAQARLVQSKLQEGRAWRLSREPGGRPRSIAALREAVTPETKARVRNELICTLALVDLEEIYRREIHASGTYTDSRLERHAVALADGSIEVYEGLDAPAPIARLPGKGEAADYVFLSPGGIYLAAAYDGGTMKVWDVNRQKELFATSIVPRVFKVTFDQSGARFAYLRKEGTIAICSLPACKEVSRLEEQGHPTFLELDPSGTRLAAAGLGFNASTVLIYDISTGKVLHRLHHPHTTFHAAWHPSGKQIAVACHDYKVHIWDVETGARLRSFDGHSAEVTQVAFSHGGRFLASWGWDNRTLLRESGTGDVLAEAAGRFLAFSPDDRRLAFEQHNKLVGIWRLSGGDCFRVLPAPLAGKGPVDVDISPDGRWLAAACVWDGFRVWGTESLDEVYHVKVGSVWSVRFAGDGSALWTSAKEGLYRWPLVHKAPGEGWAMGPPETISREPSRHLALSRDGRFTAQVMAAASSERIVVRDLQQGAREISSLAQAGATRSGFSPSGRWLVSTTYHGEDVRVWSLADASLAHVFQVGTAQAAFSPDERWLAVVTSPQITLYEAGSWAQRFQTKKEAVDGTPGVVAFSADGRHVAASLSRSLVALLRVEDGAEVARFEAPNSFVPIGNLCFSADEGFLVGSSETNKVLIWNLHHLRRELQAIGLDWLPREPTPGPAIRNPERLRVDTGSLPAGVPPSQDRAVYQNRVLNGHSLLLELDPSVEAFRERAAAFERVGDFGSALADLDRVLKAAPDDAPALVSRAAVHERLGQRDEALKDNDRAIDILLRAAADPTTGAEKPSSILLQARRVRARLHSGGGLSQSEDALSDWRELLAILPADLEASENFAWLWVVCRCRESEARADAAVATDAQLALACAEKTYASAPENGSFARNLGAVYCHLGRWSEARPLLEKARRLNQQLLSATLHLAVAEHQSGDPAKARDLFEAASFLGRKNLADGSPMRPYFDVIRGWAEREIAVSAPSVAR